MPDCKRRSPLTVSLEGGVKIGQVSAGERSRNGGRCDVRENREEGITFLTNKGGGELDSPWNIF